FLSKEMFFAESVGLARLGELAWVVPLLATLGGLFSVAYSLRFAWDVFYGVPRRDLDQTSRRMGAMDIPVMVLVVPCILIGLVPAAIVGGTLELAAGSVLGSRMPEVHLSLFHGVNLPFVMSLMAYAGGGLFFASRKQLLDWHGERIRVVTTTLLYNQFLGRVMQVGRVLTQALHNDALQ